jgi:hypothetical protein
MVAFSIMPVSPGGPEEQGRPSHRNVLRQAMVAVIILQVPGAIKLFFDYVVTGSKVP